MKKSLGVLTLLIMTFLLTSAQQQKLKFRSINSIGLIAGARENNVLIQSTNGITYNAWYTGIGIGMDYYKYNTIPVFAHIRRSFGKANNGFAFGDVGLNLPHKNKPGDELVFSESYSFRKGIYTD